MKCAGTSVFLIGSAALGRLETSRVYGLNETGELKGGYEDGPGWSFAWKAAWKIDRHDRTRAIGWRTSTSWAFANSPDVLIGWQFQATYNRIPVPQRIISDRLHAQIPAAIGTPGAPIAVSDAVHSSPPSLSVACPRWCPS